MSKQQNPEKKRQNTILTVKEDVELMTFLITEIPHKNRNNIKAILRNKQICINDKEETRHNYKLKSGDKVDVRWNRISETKSLRGISIVYEDDSLIIIDKHSGLLSVPTPRESKKTALSMVTTYLERKKTGDSPYVVHMLDRETSGLMILAKNQQIKQTMQKNWHELIVERKYLAIVEGIPEQAEGTVTSYLIESKALKVHSTQSASKGNIAITHYKTLKSKKNFSLLEIVSETSNKHQTRVHMQDIGNCIVGDSKYGSTTNPIGRMGLHAWTLVFKHPVSGEELSFKTAKPRKFLRIV